jgi:cob(I)alamin adenosyltransferase
MKIYTKGGDGGETGLLGGRRLRKSEPRVEAYGDVDELNAHLGSAAALLAQLPLPEELREIQSDLFVLGAHLATAPGSPAAGRSDSLEKIGEARVKRLEEIIDLRESDLTPLKNFILPGGSPGAAALQVCRAVCRRAERSVVRLSHSEEVDPRAVVYLNRLSDLLFVLARWVNAREGISEPIWKGPEG